MSSILWTLLAVSASGSVLTLILFLVKPFIRESVSKAFLYYVWIVVLLRLIIPVGIPITMPNATRIFTSNEPTIQSTSDNISEPHHNYELDASGFENTIPNADTSVIASDELLPDATTSNIDSKAHNAINWNSVIIAIWLGGATLCLALNLVSYFIYSRQLIKSFVACDAKDLEVLKSISRNTHVRLVCSNEISTPMLVGIFKPTIVLPNYSYSKNGKKNQLRGILLHELTHHYRFDLVYKWGVIFVSSIHWFNPLVYLMRRDIWEMCELSCDEAVISKMNDSERKEYGNTLLAYAAKKQTPIDLKAAAFCKDKMQLERRLLGIMNYKNISFAAVILMVALTLLLTGCASVLAANNDLIEDGAAVSESVEGQDYSSIMETNSTSDSTSVFDPIKLNLCTEAPADKVSIQITPSEIREHQYYYFVPDPETQESINTYLAESDIQWSEPARLWEGHIEAGWTVVKGDCMYLALEDGYFYGTNLADYSECLFKNQAMFDLIQSELKDKINYGSIPVSRIDNIVSATLEISGHRIDGQRSSQTITDPEVLSQFEEWFSKATPVFRGADCGNKYATLELTLEDSTTIKMSIATDDCPNINLNGVFYNYKPAEYRTDSDDADGWYSNQLFKHFDDIPWADGFKPE